ncbi:Lrp/AsnC family transcriptional regulator [Burkholderia stagnalis]
MKPKQTELDRLDWRIIEALQAHARVTNTELGKRIGLSQPAVTARIRRLEEQGVIEGYSARINAERVGRDISALIRIQTTHARIAKCLKTFESMPEIIDAHRITGDDCFIVRVAVQRMSRLEAVIDALAVFGPVTTSIVLASYPPKAIGELK